MSAAHADVMHELSLVLVLEERDEQMTARWLEHDGELMELFRDGQPERCRAALQEYLEDSRHNLKRWATEERGPARGHRRRSAAPPDGAQQAGATVACSRASPFTRRAGSHPTLSREYKDIDLVTT